MSMIGVVAGVHYDTSYCNSRLSGKAWVDFRYLTATGKYIAEKKPDMYPDKDRFLFYYENA